MRNSKWTQIYWGTVDGKDGLFPFVRLVPDFMDTAAAGAPHGIPIGHCHCEDEDSANKYADLIDRFFDRMVAEMDDDKEELYGGVPFCDLSSYDKERVNQGILEPDDEEED